MKRLTVPQRRTLRSRIDANKVPRFSSAALRHASAVSRIAAAANNRFVMHMPVRLVMRYFGMSTANAKEAVSRAWRIAEGSGTAARERTIKEQDRIVRSLRKAEKKYPNICTMIAVNDNLKAVAKYFEVSVAWIYYVRGHMQNLAHIQNKSLRIVGMLASQNNLPATQREIFEAEHRA